MMRLMLISAVLGLLGVGCAHGLMRGSVAMKVNDQEAHVCLGENDVKAGDKVTLYKNQCVGKGSGRYDVGAGGCTKVRLGEGTILRTLNEHYSIMKVDPQVAFEEGTIVEKQ